MATQASPVLDVRADFPILSREIDGKRLVYLDSAASAQKPEAMLQAMDRFYRTSYANVHRGVYTLAQEATDAFEGARERVAAFVGGESQTTVFTRNGTEALNLVARSWGLDNVAAGDVVLVTEMEHHSNLVPWQMLCQETGARLRYLEVDSDGRVSLDQLDEELGSGDVKVVAGTDVIAEAVGLGAAVDYLAGLGMDRVRAHERELTARALEGLGAIDGVTVVGPPGVEDRGGVISFAIEGMHPHDVADLLNRDNVCVRAGHHCAQVLMRKLGVAATARASFGPYNVGEDVDALLDSVTRARDVFAG